jgi:hypothetical protein
MEVTMDPFPALDPIPLPAPVWLFKLLHVVTLTLHFGSVYFLVGGMVCATWWAWRGRATQNAALLDASGAVAHRLPVVMAYVINLGVPPLLFSQVLYGRALYTSSVVIGVQWLAVVPMVIAAYYILYMMAKRAETGRRFAWLGLVAILIVLKVGYVYSANMTLMLRPEAWTEMYRSDPLGTSLPEGDPTIAPRWLFMMVGSLGMVGVATLLLGMYAPLAGPSSAFLRRSGGRWLMAGVALQIVIGAWVVVAQPAPVRGALLGAPLSAVLLGLWALTAALLAATGGLAVRDAASPGWKWPGVAAGLAFVNTLLWVLVRDSIRDISLRQKGFEVWDRAVYANWSSILLFLLLFVGVGISMAWMGRIVFNADKGGTEHYA